MKKLREISDGRLTEHIQEFLENYAWKVNDTQRLRDDLNAGFIPTMYSGYATLLPEETNSAEWVGFLRFDCGVEID